MKEHLRTENVAQHGNDRKTFKKRYEVLAVRKAMESEVLPLTILTATAATLCVGGPHRGRRGTKSRSTAP